MKGLRPSRAQGIQTHPRERGPSFGPSWRLLPPLSARAKDCRCNPSLKRKKGQVNAWPKWFVAVTAAKRRWRYS